MYLFFSFFTLGDASLYPPGSFGPAEYPWALMLSSLCGLCINLYLQLDLPHSPLLPLAEPAEPMPGNGGHPSVPVQSPFPT